MTSNKKAQAILKKLDKLSKQNKKFIQDIDKRVAEAELGYAKTLMENDIRTMQAAKKIVEEDK